MREFESLRGHNNTDSIFSTPDRLPHRSGAVVSRLIDSDVIIEGTLASPIVPGSSKIAVAGAGMSGAVVARQLAEAGHSIQLFEARDHVAGNCHTERDDTGILVHRYGPHIFHTASERVWNYMNRFGEMVPYRHSVKATVHGEVFGLPVNLTTINQFFGTDMTGPQAEAFIADRAAPFRSLQAARMISQRSGRRRSPPSGPNSSTPYRDRASGGRPSRPAGVGVQPPPGAIHR